MRIERSERGSLQPSRLLAGCYRHHKQTPFLFALLSCSCVAMYSSASIAKAALNPPQIAAKAWALAKANQVPAMAIVVFEAGHPVHVQAFGHAAGRPVTAQTPFRWGSITKSFTALAVLDLAEQGHIKLNDPLATHLPKSVKTLAFNNPFPTNPLRVHHLLELTAGLPDLSKVEWQSARPITLKDALRLNPQNRTLRWPAGLQHSYSNTPPGLSALLIEHVTGRPFANQLRQRVLLPLGMIEASVGPVPLLPGGFKADGKTPIEYWHMTYPAFGALNASIVELLKLPQALLNQGEVDGTRRLSDFQLTHVRTPSTGLAAAAGLPIGYAAGVYARISNGVVWWGHGGDADGYRSRYAVNYRSGRGYVIVINADNAPLLRRLVSQVELALARGVVAKKLSHFEVDAAALKPLEGEYYPSGARFGLNAWSAGKATRASVVLRDNGLVFSQGRTEEVLIPVNENQFRRSNDPQATVAFVKDHEGFLYLQGELGNFVKLQGDKCPSYFASCP